MRISVVVPCASKHVPLLPTLIEQLSKQTRAPDEVVVSVSGCSSSDVPDLNVELVHSKRALSAGANRNRASAIACGDVLIYQDADDVPHPQRVEIIAAMFESHAIDHLMHFFYYLESEPAFFPVDEAVCASGYRTNLLEYHRPLHAGLVEAVTNGNVAVSRELSRQIPWPEYQAVGEDVEFNRTVYASGKRSMVIALPLITYRHELSSFK